MVEEPVPGPAQETESRESMSQEQQKSELVNPILREFDAMMIELHDRRGHQGKDVTQCVENVCVLRIGLRNELEQLLTLKPSSSRYQAFLKMRWKPDIIHPDFEWVVVDTVENDAMAYTNSKVVAESWAGQLNTQGYITDVEVRNG